MQGLGARRVRRRRLAVEKLEHQLHKLKTKLVRRNRARQPTASGPTATTAPTPPVGAERRGAPTTTRRSDEPRIVKTKAFRIKPMTPEEAVLQMDLLGHDFFFFTNADTERAAVVYRRDDGDVGLIDEA